VLIKGKAEQPIKCYGLLLTWFAPIKANGNPRGSLLDTSSGIHDHEADPRWITSTRCGRLRPIAVV